MSMGTPPGVPPLYIIISFTSSSTSAAVTAAYVRVYILQKKRNLSLGENFFFLFPLRKKKNFLPLANENFVCVFALTKKFRTW